MNIEGLDESAAKPYFGNAIRDASRGWFIGPFMDGTSPLLKGAGVQVKWAAHPEGAHRDEWSPGTPEWSLSVLVEGDMTISFADGDRRLSLPGDFVIWGPATPHTWKVHAPTLVITVRWSAQIGNVAQG